ncbi:MAG: DNA polymerase I [Alphaproteobacteria bacterium]
MQQSAQSKPDAGCARLVLVDGSGYIFRAYHALPPLTRRDGTPTGAVYGFTTMLLKLRETYAGDCLTVIFDASRQSFRQEVYAAYKAHRPPAPEDLVPQFALVREATRAMNIPSIELEQFEADDLIASYAEAAAAAGQEVVIVSSDKDLMQLIRPGVAMFDPMKNKPIGEVEVMEKFGVAPGKVTEVQALIGDSTDNVPGVPGIGPKTAAELIGQYGTVENLLAHLDEIKQPKRREALVQHAGNARISRQLVELKRDAPLPVPLGELQPVPLDRAKLIEFLSAQEFTGILKRLGAHADTVIPAQAGISVEAGASGERDSRLRGNNIIKNYETITDEAVLAAWIADAIRAGKIGIDTRTTSIREGEAELVGIGLSIAPGRAAYVPLGHIEAGAAQGNMFDAQPGGGRLAPGQLGKARALEMLAPLLAHPGVLKVGHNLKYDLVVYGKAGLALSPIADIMLMSYCIAGGLYSHTFDDLAERHCHHVVVARAGLVGSGRQEKDFSEVAIEQAAPCGAEGADYKLRLFEVLRREMFAVKVTRVYETIERPLVPVIAAMEEAGVLVSPTVLGEMSVEFAGKLATLEKEIIAMAGMEFSVGSPKQLGEVLFDKLQLGGGRKSSKSGAYSTDSGVLEALAEEGHEIAAKVLEWRQFSKLKSTYTDALPKAINPKTGRVHTNFQLAVTSTGRLSSTEPNLQNIPIRTEDGRRIRTAFIAPPGAKLISADYSQIELRLLAHMAGIKPLIEAFRHGADIHAVTASQIFGVAVDKVTPDLRRSAKTINFGIIYGMSAHGLAVRLGIGRSEAASIIEAYFKQYPGIREIMDKSIAFAHAHGYVETLFGRKVHVRDINAKNPNLRNFSERAAINAPLQGTAADIIKLAMVAVDELLRHEGKGRLVLQVHDELLIESPAGDAPELARRVQQAMEQVAMLSVPLTVETGVGDHWGEIH